jgi:hypothetical protein
MNTSSIGRKLAQIFEDLESPREIPSSEECRIENRIRVTFPRLRSGTDEVNTWDAVRVGRADLVLVEMWQRISGATEDSPAPGAIFVRNGQNKLTSSKTGIFTLDIEQ